jgi:hypothetical protein
MNIKIPVDFKVPGHPQRGFAYVEFTDEQGMKAGLENHGEVRKKFYAAGSPA